jgi:hypothetical protein
VAPATAHRQKRFRIACLPLPVHQSCQEAQQLHDPAAGPVQHVNPGVINGQFKRVDYLSCPRYFAPLSMA